MRSFKDFKLDDVAVIIIICIFRAILCMRKYIVLQLILTFFLPIIQHFQDAVSSGLILILFHGSYCSKCSPWCQEFHYEWADHNPEEVGHYRVQQHFAELDHNDILTCFVSVSETESRLFGTSWFVPISKYPSTDKLSIIVLQAQ